MTTTLDLLKEARDLLAHSRAYIDATPHGDNCFVSSHYEGDPGDGCNCGKESLTDAFFNDGDDLIARLDAHIARESAQVEPVAWKYRNHGGTHWTLIDKFPAGEWDVVPLFAAPQPVPPESSFPERDSTLPVEQQGVFRKFDVRRVDGSDQPGGKHFGCEYFVLDMAHDQYAKDAIRAYAEACKATYPTLSSDLLSRYVVSQPAPAVPEGE